MKKNIYICLMMILFSLMAKADAYNEYGGTYYDTQYGTTGVNITYGSSATNWSAINAANDAQMAANAAAAASHIPVQPAIPPPPIQGPSGQGGVPPPITKTIWYQVLRFHKTDYILATGVGSLASYDIISAQLIKQDNTGKLILEIDATGITPAVQVGNVLFNCQAKLYIDNKLVATQNLLKTNQPTGPMYSEPYSMVIGSANFSIPTSGTIMITLDSGYIFSARDGTGNAASATLTQSITIRN